MFGNGGALAFAARATDARGVALRALQGGALLFAAAAYLAHLASHRPSLRELVLRSGLVTDFAFVLMPWRLAEP